SECLHNHALTSIYSFFSPRHRHHRDPHSFPTRRSSDLSNIPGDKTQNSNGGYDYWLVKLDTSGNIISQNSIGGSADESAPYILQDRKSTRLSSHVKISYAVFCLKKKKKMKLTNVD